MLVSTSFDGGAGSATVEGDAVIFDVTPGRSLIHVLLRDTPASVTLHFRLDTLSALACDQLLGQGVVLSDDGVSFRAVPLRPGGGLWSAVVEPVGGELRVSTRYVYGRDALDELLCDLHGRPSVRPRLLRRQHRTTPVIDFGDDDGTKIVHYVIAGEDVGETSGSLVADAMARNLLAGGASARALMRKSIVRIVPVASPYCAARPQGGSYDTLDGQSIYGAATWGDALPPPEYALLRDEVEKTIAARRLGLLLCLHSFQGMLPFHELEFVRVGGTHRLTADREAKAKSVLGRLMDGVPKAVCKVDEKTWHTGLARDYLMSKHDTISYRMEVTTADSGRREFVEIANRLIDNINAVPDWGFVAREISARNAD